MSKVKPPVYVLGAIAAMLAAHWFAPIARIIEFPWRLLGTVPLLLGGALVACALQLFRRHKTTAQPFGAPAALVTSGPFRVTRHPMYVGILLILSGVASLLGTVGPWLVVPVVGILFDLVFVRREEEKLEKTFGDAYRHYKSQVRRWI